MAKRLKLRICRVITATLQSCISKDPSDLPENPVPNDQNHDRHCRVSSAFVSIESGARRFPPPKQTPDADGVKGTRFQEFQWQKEEKWHVVADIYEPRQKICSSSEEDPLFVPPAPPPSAADEKKRSLKKKKKKKVKNNVPSRLRVSTSSADSGWFSSEGGGVADEKDEEETETLVSSSLSFSTDNSFSTTILPQPRTNIKRRDAKRTKRGVLELPPPEVEELEIPARLSMFKKLIPCRVDGKVKESFAVVKRSENPYEDFKNSMVDMILEKQMFDRKDLEQLLECFLSLNSRRYHGVIVQVFSEIWEAIFFPPGFNVQNHRRVPRLASIN
ncbi:hypothetical protein OROHE_017219 [Orobanche hederae]